MAPSAAFPASPTAAAPFLGTPAQSYANGAAGIVIPLANAAGSYSTAQVAAAYQVTKKMLIAANLNRPTLAGMAPDAFANLLTSQQRATFVSGLDKIGLDASGYGRSTRGWVVSFAPGSTQLVGDVIKVHGTMHAGAAAVDGSPVLRIYVDYRADGYVDFATFSDPGGPLEPWWEVSGGGVAGARCDVNDGFVHPDFPGGPPDNVNATGPAVNPYDQSTRPPTGPACHRTSGT